MWHLTRWAEGSWVEWMLDNRDVKVNLTTPLTLLVFGGLYSDTLFLNFASSRKHLHLPEAFVFFRFWFFLLFAGSVQSLDCGEKKQSLSSALGLIAEAKMLFLNNFFHAIFFFYFKFMRPRECFVLAIWFWATRGPFPVLTSPFV